MLPTPTLNSWFELLRLQHPWSHSLAQRLPRWWVEPHGAAQCSGRGRCSSQEWTVRVAFQLLDDLRRHLRVSGEHHGQTICTTCPVRRDTCPCGAPEAHSAQHQREIRTTPGFRYTFIQIAKKNSSKKHFHPKTLSSKNTFIQKHFRPKPFHPKGKTISSTTLSSKNGFIQ